MYKYAVLGGLHQGIHAGCFMLLPGLILYKACRQERRRDVQGKSQWLHAVQCFYHANTFKGIVSGLLLRNLN